MMNETSPRLRMRPLTGKILPRHTNRGGYSWSVSGELGPLAKSARGEVGPLAKSARAKSARYLALGPTKHHKSCNKLKERSHDVKVGNLIRCNGADYTILYIVDGLSATSHYPLY